MSFWQSQIILRAACPLCDSTQRTYLFKKTSYTVGIPDNFFKCDSCGFVYSESALSPAGISAFYQEKYVRSNYTEYSSFSHLKIMSFKARLQNVINIQKAKNPNFIDTFSVLDLGCGTGISMLAAKQLGLNVTGVEVSKTAVEIANGMNVGPVHCSDLHELDHLGLGEFDLIVLFDVLDHVPDPVKVLSAAEKLLKPGGTMLIEVCDIDSLYAKLMGKYYTHVIPFEHFSYFNSSTLKALVEKCGLSSGEVKDLKRPISLAFLIATLKEFNPLLGRVLSPLLYFKKLSGKVFHISIGVITMTVHKPERKG